jgi:hypothetical protein
MEMGFCQRSLGLSKITGRMPFRSRHIRYVEHSADFGVASDVPDPKGTFGSESVMQASMSGDTLSGVLVNEITAASILKVTTVGGDAFSAYDPILIGHDHISFYTTAAQDERAFVKWDAIASLTVKK